ncbi:MAG: methyltransferase [Candidatus Hydrogenedentes bacterium]|nr:methyltransferase [Candidatus Hydrogenedentota bacterium]
MTSRERVVKALESDRPDRVPRDLWTLPGVRLNRANELKRMYELYPSDIGAPLFRYGKSLRQKGTEGVVGTYTDEWGCEWTVGEVGVSGEVKNPPLADWSALDGYTPPWELLEGVDLAATNAYCQSTDKFMRAGTHVRPFERMQFLRGTENMLADVLMQTDEFFRLRNMIHDFNIRELEMWANTKVDAVSFMDDWGAQSNLLIDPDLWRELFKPLYREYCEIIKSSGKYVFMHSDGHIRAIIPDLIEIGVDAINSQLFCMDIEELGKTFKGKITFWGEICRQRIMPFGTSDDVRNAVRRVRRALDDGQGGVIAQCEWGVNDPFENIAAVFEAWEKPLEAV